MYRFNSRANSVRPDGPDKDAEITYFCFFSFL